MSRTAETSLWNQKSSYHTLRAPYAQDQVDATVFPTFHKHCVDERPNGPFRIADFACGGGAIAKGFLQRCVEKKIAISEFLLIDVEQDNIDAATALLTGISRTTSIKNYLCDGKSFASYTGAPVDFLYCWDAMVHFDILDVARYIESLNKVLRGVAFMHHSNYTVVTENIHNNPHARNVMSKDIFRQFCLSAGYEVIEQNVIAWGDPNLDCLTTARVPGA
jgi:hypothetical protein